ncbi:protein YgfX [Shewanella sp.]|uniref:protein YgfX n=1 Tax=Shewanella sp. TaxID=50422 RepID=UPI00356679BD
MLILWSLFLTSLLAWPAYLSLSLRVLQIAIFILISGYFVCRLLHLKHWRWQFSLDAFGCLEDARGRHTLNRHWVTPFMCLMLINNQDGGRRLECVFADMLSDGDYRDLCRTLLSARGSE